MEPQSQVRNGENYPQFDSLIAAFPARLILVIGPRRSHADSNAGFNPQQARIGSDPLL